MTIEELKKISKDVLEGSKVYDANFEEWERGRKFIADQIDKAGSILDIGSANGFLLICLETWSGKKLDMYGIDTNGELIIQGKRLFPELEKNLKIAGLESFRWLEEFDLPSQYDFIFWNVWDNFIFDEYKLKTLKELIDLRLKENGKLILGFYHKDKSHNLEEANKIKSKFRHTEIVENQKDGNEVLAIIKFK
jgi:SAM-dependent methyltransferase